MSARGPAAPSVEELLDEIMQAPYGMPVRLMEAVVDRGAAAVPAVVRALEQWDEEDDGDALWLVVLLGVLGDERAVPALIAVMRRTDLDLLAPAAAEALAMVGAPAVPALLDVGRSGEPLERLHAYAALGWIQSDAAYAGLIEALGRDLPMADVLAIALISHQRREAVPAIYAAYRQCEPWQRTDLEDALRTIDRGDVDPPLWRSDWRLRYRRQPDLGDAIAPEWHTVSALFREDAELRARRPLTELSTLDDILAAPDAVDEPAVCQECGQVLEWPMGVAICPDTAVAIGLFQLEILTRAREDGIDDVFELLDELEDEEMQLLEEKEREDEVEDAREPTPQAEERADRIQELAEARATACWLVEQGIESVEEGEAAIARELSALAERHGDPDHLLAPPPPVRAPVKVGRNDPCPCGSGRKYKRCCLDRE